MAGGTSVAARLARFAGLAGDRFFPDRLFLLLDRRLRGRFCHRLADRWRSPRGRLAPSRAPAGLARSATGAIPSWQFLALAHQAKVDPAAVQIHAADLHPPPCANRIPHPPPLPPPFPSPPSSVMSTRPSTSIASSVTKIPKLVTALTTPLYSSPRCSRMYLHLSQASTSRLASSARRPWALQCGPAACQARPARPSACWRGLLPGAASRLASLACASPGAGSAGNWYCVLPKMALMTRCTSRSG